MIGIFHCSELFQSDLQSIESQRVFICFDVAVQSGSINPKIGEDAEGNNIYHDLIGELTMVCSTRQNRENSSRTRNA